MRRSKDEAAETRERIVSTASKMFLEKGLAGVGMRDIMSAAGLTPGGFYRHFESKEQLIAEATTAAFDRLFAMFDSRTAGKSPSEAAEMIVFIYLNQWQREGNTYFCPLATNGVELGHCGDVVLAAATDGHQRLERLLAKCLTHLSRREALALASAIVSTMVGAVTLSNIVPDTKTARAILNNAHALIKTQLSLEKSLSKKKENTKTRRHDQ